MERRFLALPTTAHYLLTWSSFSVTNTQHLSPDPTQSRPPPQQPQWLHTSFYTLISSILAIVDSIFLVPSTSASPLNFFTCSQQTPHRYHRYWTTLTTWSFTPFTRTNKVIIIREVKMHVIYDATRKFSRRYLNLFGSWPCRGSKGNARDLPLMSKFGVLRQIWRENERNVGHNVHINLSIDTCTCMVGPGG